MKSTAIGAALVDQYYEIAPSIVEALNESDQKDLIYSMLWQLYIRPCLKLIVDEKPAECQQLYQEMVEMLQNHIHYSVSVQSTAESIVFRPVSCDDTLETECDHEMKMVYSSDGTQSSGSENDDSDEFPDVSQAEEEPHKISSDNEGIESAESQDSNVVWEESRKGIIEDFFEARGEDLISNPLPRWPVVFCVDISKTLSEDAVEELNAGLNSCIATIKEKLKDCGVCEVCIVAFDSEAILVKDFCAVDRLDVPVLSSRGKSMHVAKGVNMALDMATQRVESYKQYGVDYYLPQLFLISGGHRFGEAAYYDVNLAEERVHELVKSCHLDVVPICIGSQFNEETLHAFSPKIKLLHMRSVESEQLWKDLFVFREPGFDVSVECYDQDIDMVELA